MSSFDQLTRRSFIKTAGTAAGGTVLIPINVPTIGIFAKMTICVSFTPKTNTTTGLETESCPFLLE